MNEFSVLDNCAAKCIELYTPGTSFFSFIINFDLVRKRVAMGVALSASVAAVALAIAAVVAVSLTSAGAIPLIAGLALTSKITLLAASGLLGLVATASFVVHLHTLRWIFTKDMEKEAPESIMPSDFALSSSWTKEEGGTRWAGTEEPAYLIDGMTGRKYWNETKICVRLKCALLALGTPLAHPISLLYNIAVRVVRLVSFSHFWGKKEGEDSSVQHRLQTAAIDFGKILLAPLTLLALEASAIYGIISPYNGRKLYATFERLQYGDYILAPCFQPKPRAHMFGGDPSQQNAF